jgi:2-phospho-L-lactate guanylyltransferase
LPIKDLLDTKTRLKSALASKYFPLIEKLVEICFTNTVNIIKTVNCPFGVISPSISILGQIRKSGAVFTFQDSGIDLNRALTTAIQEILQDQPVLIMMPDLPFLDPVFFHTILKETKNVDALIIPSVSQNNDFGTAALYLREPNLLKFEFGNNSSRRFQYKAESIGLKYKLLNLSPYSRDLDTLDDVKYLEQHLSQVIEPELYSNILNQIDLEKIK